MAAAQLMPGGGGSGGSLEWLPDDPGFEAPDCGFFICMKKATIIMNLAGRGAASAARGRHGEAEGEVCGCAQGGWGVGAVGVARRTS